MESTHTPHRIICYGNGYDYANQPRMVQHSDGVPQSTEYVVLVGREFFYSVDRISEHHKNALFGITSGNCNTAIYEHKSVGSKGRVKKRNRVLRMLYDRLGHEKAKGFRVDFGHAVLPLSLHATQQGWDREEIDEKEEKLPEAVPEHKNQERSINLNPKTLRITVQGPGDQPMEFTFPITKFQIE